jgi:hypothetical protein
MNNKGRLVLYALGALAVFGGFFFGTLVIMEKLDSRARDETRVQTVKSILDALEKYRVSKGAYPVLPDRPITQLTDFLAAGGYVDTIRIPPGAEPTHYVSYDGKSYGLWVHLENSEGPCRIAVGSSGSGWWGEPPKCQF